MGSFFSFIFPITKIIFIHDNFAIQPLCYYCIFNLSNHVFNLKKQLLSIFQSILSFYENMNTRQLKNLPVFSANSDSASVSYPVCWFWFLPFIVLNFLNYFFPPMSDDFFPCSFPYINTLIDLAVIIVHENFLGTYDSSYCHNDECWDQLCPVDRKVKVGRLYLKGAERTYVDNVSGPVPHRGDKSLKSPLYRPFGWIPTVSKKWPCRFYPVGKYNRQQAWKQGPAVTIL